MKLTSKQRQTLFDKYDGRCAYCGDPLLKWHADHLIPIRRLKVWDSKLRKWITTGMQNPEADCIENMMPACPSCNMNKHSDTLEQFRANIAKYLLSLNKYSVQYKMTKRYGLVQETNDDVVFYFETQ